MKVQFPMYKQLVVVYGFLFFVGLSVPLLGQGGKGAIQGIVSDQTGSYVPGVDVSVTSLSTNQTFSAVSSESGLFRLLALPIGDYRLAASLAGFKTFVRERVTVQTATVTTVDVMLQLGDVTEEVTVLGSEITLNTVDAEVGTVMERDVLLDLPLALSGQRRQAEQFVLLVPGVTGSVGSKSINGGQGYSDEVSFDGSTSTTLWIPGYSLNLSPPYEAVGEFKVHNTLAPVEYGRGFGAVEFNLKSGTNEYHGSVFEFLRNDKLDARAFFARQKDIVRQNEFGGSFGGPVKLPGYDGSERTFFFFSLSGFERRGGSASTSFVTLPTQAMRAGDFSDWPYPIFDPLTTRSDGEGGFVRDPFPDQIIPPDRIDPIATTLIPMLPALDLPGEPFNNFVNRSKRPVSEYVWSIKVDHKVSDAHHLSFTFWDLNRDEDRYGAVPGELDTLVVFRTEATPIRGNWDWSVSPQLLNHFTFGYTQLKPNEQQPDSRTGNTLFNIPNLPNDAPGIPTFSITGVTTLGNASAMPVQKDTDNYNVVDSVTWARGDHQFKFGFEYLRKHAHWVQARNELGTYSYSNRSTSQPNESFSTWGSGWASFLLGQTYTGTRVFNPLDRTFYEHIATFYAEDRMQLTPKLTLTAGIRYDMPWYLREKEDRVSALDLDLPNPDAGGYPGALALYGSGPGLAGEIDSIIGPDYRRAWSPRLGIAYRLNDETVVRAGYGLFHFFTNAQRAAHGVVYHQGFQPSPFVTTTDLGVTPGFILSEGFPVADLPIPDTNPSQANGGPIDYANPSGYKSATNVSWNFSIQRGLSSNMFLDIAYVGNRNDRITSGLEDINQLHPDYLSLGSLLLANINSPDAEAAGIPLPYPGFEGSVAQALRPYPQFTDIRNNSQPTGSNRYHSLQLSLQKRYSKGSSLLLSYTLSKSLGNAGTNTFSDAFAGSGGARYRALNTYARDLEWSHTALDQTHVFVLSWIYELPFGRGKRFGGNWGGALNNILGEWQLQAIHRYQSSTTIAVTGGSTLPGFAGGNRPNWVSSDVRSSAGMGDFDPATDRYLNSSAFAQPGPFTIGDAPRRIPSVRGPAYYNEDFSLIKRIFISEDFNLQFRAEFFNVFNRVVFNAPSSNFNNLNTFGQLRSVQSPRVIQIGFKLQF